MREIVALITESMTAEMGMTGEATSLPAPEYRDAGKFWEKYPALFEGPYPMSLARLEKEVDKYSEGCTAKARELLGFETRVSPAEGFRRTVAHALALGLASS